VGERFQIERIAALLRTGLIAGHLDLDVRIKREFSDTLRGQPYDLIVSRAYDFPDYAARQLGFVACLGFWLAKPTALPLVEAWLHEMRDSASLAPDQDAFNRLLLRAAPETNSIRLADYCLPVEVFSLYGCSIAVLPHDAVMRNLDDRAIFANHDRAMFARWVRRAALRHPLRTGRQLLSTTGAGKLLIRLRAILGSGARGKDWVET
jgi:hypothetical protein